MFFLLLVATGGLTLLHAAHVAKLRLVFAVLTSAGARLQSVLLADGPGAALWGLAGGRRTSQGQIADKLTV